jgi:hypothetical protein
MSKHGTWTVIFVDQMIVKRTGEFNITTAKGYVCGSTDFWMQPKFSNLHVIQFTDDNVDNDQVEYADNRPNGKYDASILGDFQQFIDLWDAKHLSVLQENWDNDNASTAKDAEGNPIMETVEEKITRLGQRPTSYSS